MSVSVLCPTCGAALKIPDAVYDRRVAGQVSVLRCKRCKGPMEVDGRHSPPKVRTPAAGEEPPKKEAEAQVPLAAKVAQQDPEQQPAAAAQAPPQKETDTEPRETAETPPDAATVASAATAARLPSVIPGLDDNWGSVRPPPPAAVPKFPSALTTQPDPAPANEKPKSSPKNQKPQQPLARKEFKSTPRDEKTKSSPKNQKPQQPLARKEFKSAPRDEKPRSSPKNQKPQQPLARKEFKSAPRDEKTKSSPQNQKPQPPLARKEFKSAPRDPRPGASPQDQKPQPLLANTSASAVDAPATQDAVPNFTARPNVISDELTLWRVSYDDESDDDRELDESQIHQELERGAIDQDTIVWRPGMDEWLPIAEVPALAVLLPAGRTLQDGVAHGFPLGQPAAADGPRWDAPHQQAPSQHKLLFDPATTTSAEPISVAPQELFDEGIVTSIRPEMLLNEAPNMPAAALAPPPRTAVAPPPLRAAAAAPPPPPRTAAAPPPLRAAAATPPHRPATAPPEIPEIPEAAPQRGSTTSPFGMAPLRSPALAPITSAAPSLIPQFRSRRGPVLVAIGAAVATAGIVAYIWSHQQGPEPSPYSRTDSVTASATATATDSPQNATANATPSTAEQPSTLAARPGTHGNFFRQFAAAVAKNGDGTSSTEQGGFDQKVALVALEPAVKRAASCRQHGSRPGAADVALTLNPSGRVSKAKVTGGPFVGTPTARCIEARLRTARVPPFSGSPITINKVVEVR